MAKANKFVDYIVSDALGHIPSIVARAMFGGYGLYRDGRIFGIIVESQLYLKVDDTNRADYERLESEPFTYSNKGKTYAMSYWLVPDEILENRGKVKTWLEKAWNINRAKKKS